MSQPPNEVTRSVDPTTNMRSIGYAARMRLIDSQTYAERYPDLPKVVRLPEGKNQPVDSLERLPEYVINRKVQCDMCHKKGLRYGYHGAGRDIDLCLDCYHLWKSPEMTPEKQTFNMRYFFCGTGVPPITGWLEFRPAP